MKAAQSTVALLSLLCCFGLPFLISTVLAADLEVGNKGESTGSPYLAGSDQNWDYVYVAKNAGSTGVIEQSAGIFRHYNDMFLGYMSGTDGTYTQTGGTKSGGVYFTFIGYVGGKGTYSLDNGSMNSRIIYVGYSGGTGDFNQTDGYCSTSGTNNAVYVGYSGTGTYNLSGGTLYTQTFTAGVAGTGTVHVSGGELTPTNLNLGHNGTGSLTQSDGTVAPSNILALGYQQIASNGTYNLNGGALTAKTAYIGESGKGTFSQSGGSFTVSGSYPGGGEVRVGNKLGSEGIYTIGGGSFAAKDLYVSNYSTYSTYGKGAFNITNPLADITISGIFRIGSEGHFTAAPGSTIKMTGTQFENYSKNPDNVAGLNNTSFVFDPVSSGTYDFFEVGGADMGHETPDGFVSNFAIHSLRIGGTNWLNLYLRDDFDNQSDGVGNEVLYVKNLVLGENSNLYLNGVNVFYESFVNLGGTVYADGGQMYQIPEPSALVLLFALGILTLAARSSKIAFSRLVRAARQRPL